MPFFYFHMRISSIFRRMQSAHHKMTHMDASPEDRGVTASLFNPTCSLRPPLLSTKLELCPALSTKSLALFCPADINLRCL